MLSVSLNYVLQLSLLYIRFMARGFARIFLDKFHFTSQVWFYSFSVACWHSFSDIFTSHLNFGSKVLRNPPIEVGTVCGLTMILYYMVNYLKFENNIKKEM